MSPALTVQELERRILAYARQCVESGVISENRLAIAMGLSQPHVHHVLKGKRRCSPAIADAIVRALGITAMDLYTLEELRELIHAAVERTRARMQAELELAASLDGHGSAGSSLQEQRDRWSHSQPETGS